MAHFNTIMHQLLTHIPRHRFETLVQNEGADHYVKKLTTWNQFSALLYAHAGGKDSLRDIQNGLWAQGNKTYHLGLPNRVCRSTLADANKKRSWRIYEGLFYRILERCRSITPRHKFRFKNPLYSLDATVIDLCLSVFPWARFRRSKGALKLHYQLDHGGHIPTFLTVTEGSHHEISIAQQHIALVPDSIYCVDRGYTSFGWFRRIHEAGAYFVIRIKSNFAYRITGQQETLKNKGVLLDATIERTAHFTSEHDDPLTLRLIRYYDKENDRTFEFLTNNFRLAATTIAHIYKARWQIESFFRWIKQNLKIKTFLGTSKNAVLTQVWVAMVYYLLLAYIKYQTKYRYSLFYLHRIIRETLLDRLPIIDLLNINDKRKPALRGDPQLFLAF